ncbi:histidine kinase [Pyxidicoccus fallax]|uniref:Histidine kinase n=1 Tax=Pyxidicoccus fallax TaxID=394095 RepID=A0A848LZG8_9BACT|nr:histidine kinase [Pyxidicoccus fallax]NMO22723.1 histidine kinase [Pyxidicoccus fallax]NPC84832.1 histidine kinase [Pyxidicoccus fallax]
MAPHSIESTPLREAGWRWPRLRARPVWALFGLFLGVGLWNGMTVTLTILGDGGTVPGREPFVWEITGALGAWAALPVIQTAVLNAPGPHVGWARFLGIHAAGYLLFTALHIALMVPPRYPLYALFGWGPYHYGDLAFRIPMEAQKDLILYAAAATVWSLLNAWRERQARVLRQAELESELRTARLQALTGQLHPHFLFNALNTISSVMYEDLARTDRLLSDLGGLLRASLDRREPTWTLAEERAHTERFVALLAARFGERVTVRWDVAPGLEDARVPCFALQALVENAVKHNQDRREALEVRIRAREDGAGWRLEVEDTGRGFGEASPATGPGVGLTHLERILALLHGGRARMERGQGPEGGARVSLWLPREVPA